MSGDDLKKRIAQIAREAFDAGVRAAAQTRSERDRQCLRMQAFAQDVLGNACEAEAQRRAAEQGGA